MADDWAQRAVEWTGSFLRDTATGRSRYRTNTDGASRPAEGSASTCLEQGRLSQKLDVDKLSA
jgi:hypothetical protein